MRRFALVVLTALTLVLSTFSPALAAVPDVWAKNLGADTWIRSIQYVAPNVFVAGSETNGVFKASSPGGPWTDITGDLPADGRQVRQAVVLGGQYYLATSAGLFTGNGGGSWQKLGVSPGTPADQRLDQGGVQSVVFPTGQASTIVVATSGSARDGVFRSTDGGATWARAAGLFDATVYLTGEPGKPMYAAATSGFWVSANAGASWTLISDGIPPAETPRRIAMAPDPQHLVASTTGGVFRSDDFGASWYEVTGSGSTALTATDVRAFELAPTQYWTDGEPVIVAGTNNGVWASLDGGAGWARMSSAKSVSDGVSMGNESVWSLEVAGPTVLAGTQGHGIFTLPLQPAEAPATIPAPSGAAVENAVLTASTGTWLGTAPFAYRYRWYRCTQASAVTCDTNTVLSTDRTYQPQSGDVGKYLRVGISARSVLSVGWSAEKLSEPIGPIAAPPGAEPTPPFGYPKLLNPASAPWGTTMTIDPSDDSQDRWRSNGLPAPTTFQYRWARCAANGTDCEPLEHTGVSYTTTVEDVGHTIEARVIGTIGSTSSPARLAGLSGSVYEKTPVNTDAPRAVGPAYVGTVLQSTAGAWTGNGPTFTRRWMRCNAQGLQCAVTNPVVTTPTYAVTEADRGAVMRVEVTATVYDQFMPAGRKGTVLSTPSPVVGSAPVPPGGGGGGGGGTPAVPVVKLDKPKKVKPGAKLKGPTSVAGFTSISYQWLRNGKPIKGATGAKYKITRKDRGKKVSLRMVLTGPSGTVTVTTNAVKVPKAKRKGR